MVLCLYSSVNKGRVATLVFLGALFSILLRFQSNYIKRRLKSPLLYNVFELICNTMQFNWTHIVGQVVKKFETFFSCFDSEKFLIVFGEFLVFEHNFFLYNPRCLWLSLCLTLHLVRVGRKIEIKAEIIIRNSLNPKQKLAIWLQVRHLTRIHTFSLSLSLKNECVYRRIFLPRCCLYFQPFLSFFFIFSISVFPLLP